MMTSGDTTFLSAGGESLPTENNGPPQDLPLLQGPPFRYYVTCVRLSSAEDEVNGGFKAGGPLTYPHARLIALDNTEREAVQGVDVYTFLEDAEDSTDEGYEARFVCMWGNEQLVAGHIIKRLKELAVACTGCPYGRIPSQPTDATLRKQIKKAARSRKGAWPHSKKWAEKKVEGIRQLWKSSWWGKFRRLGARRHVRPPTPRPYFIETQEATR
eukprot:jgi/Tetstr1/439306/TSEL_027747.t1